MLSYACCVSPEGVVFAFITPPTPTTPPTPDIQPKHELFFKTLRFLYVHFTSVPSSFWQHHRLNRLEPPPPPQTTTTTITTNSRLNASTFLLSLDTRRGSLLVTRNKTKPDHLPKLVPSLLTHTCNQIKTTATRDNPFHNSLEAPISVTSASCVTPLRTRPSYLPQPKVRLFARH